MSALPPKADIGTHSRDVRFVPKADIGLKETLSCAVRTAREPSLQGSPPAEAGAKFGLMKLALAMTDESQHDQQIAARPPRLGAHLPSGAAARDMLAPLLSGIFHG